jgi:hypothetical protein
MASETLNPLDTYDRLDTNLKQARAICQLIAADPGQDGGPAAHSAWAVRDLLQNCQAALDTLFEAIKKERLPLADIAAFVKRRGE